MRIILFCSLFTLEIFAKSVCLNMIVKDESKVITRCLETVKPYIDHWVIVDTGSTDGTQEIIQEYMSDIPGELYEQPWVNFGHNRNEALKLAKGKADYVLFIDADEVLEGSIDREALNLDVYLAPVRVSSSPLVTFQRALLINNERDWYWKGVLHESLKCEIEEPTYTVAPHVILSAESKEGNRSQDPQKYLKDALTLEKALIEEPDNADYVYYLAQSYLSAQDAVNALKNYRKRSKMNGWDQHTFWSMYYASFLQMSLNYDAESIIKGFCNAFHYRPIRAEPLFRLAEYFFSQKNYILSFLLAQYANKMPMPNDIVYVEEWMYQYGILAVLGNSALEMGHIKEAANAYKAIAKKPDLPDFIFQQASAKSIFFEQELAKQLTNISH